MSPRHNLTLSLPIMMGLLFSFKRVNQETGIIRKPQVWTCELLEQRLWFKWLIFTLIRVRLRSPSLCCAFLPPSHQPHTPLGPLRRIWGLTERDQTVARPEPFNSVAQLRLGERRLGGYNKRVWESLQGRAQRKKEEQRARNMAAVVFILYTIFLKELAEDFVELHALLAASNRNLKLWVLQ